MEYLQLLIQSWNEKEGLMYLSMITYHCLCCFLENFIKYFPISSKAVISNQYSTWLQELCCPEKVVDTFSSKHPSLKYGNPKYFNNNPICHTTVGSSLKVAEIKTRFIFTAHKMKKRMSKLSYHLTLGERRKYLS